MLLGGSSFFWQADSIGIASTIASRSLIGFLHVETCRSSREWEPSGASVVSRRGGSTARVPALTLYPRCRNAKRKVLRP